MVTAAPEPGETPIRPLIVFTSAKAELHVQDPPLPVVDAKGLKSLLRELPKDALSGQQIRDLRLSGTDVTDERRVHRVAYLGDSTSAGLDENPEMYDAEILIAEMTFVASDHRPEQIKKLGPSPYKM